MDRNEKNTQGNNSFNAIFGLEATDSEKDAKRYVFSVLLIGRKKEVVESGLSDHTPSNV